MSSTSKSILRASPGDRLIIKGHRIGEPNRDAEILEVLGDNGAPPYVVRWDDGHVQCYPSTSWGPLSLEQSGGLSDETVHA